MSDFSDILPSSQEGAETKKYNQKLSDEKNESPKESYKSPKKVQHIVSRKVVEETDAELKYREKHFQDEYKVVTSDKLLCTACRHSQKCIVLDGKPIYHHPVLKVLLCNKCVDSYGDKNFSVDEDGSDKYCLWCGDGGTLYCCVSCSYAFCKKCIKRNLNRSVLDDIESGDWKCFGCNVEPLWNLRAIYMCAETYVKKRKNSYRVKNFSITKKQQSSKNNRRQRDSTDDSDSDWEKKVSSKKKCKRGNLSHSKEEDRKQKKKQGRRSQNECNETKNGDKTKKKIKSNLVSKNYNCDIESYSCNPEAETEEKLPENVDKGSATLASDWLVECAVKMSNLGQLLNSQAQIILEKIVNKETMTDSLNVSEGVDSLTSLAKLVGDSVERIRADLSLHHKCWKKRLIKRHTLKKVDNEGSSKLNAGKSGTECESKPTQGCSNKDCTSSGGEHDHKHKSNVISKKLKTTVISQNSKKTNLSSDIILESDTENPDQSTVDCLLKKSSKNQENKELQNIVEPDINEECRSDDKNFEDLLHNKCHSMNDGKLRIQEEESNSLESMKLNKSQPEPTFSDIPSEIDRQIESKKIALDKENCLSEQSNKEEDKLCNKSEDTTDMHLRKNDSNIVEDNMKGKKGSCSGNDSPTTEFMFDNSNASDNDAENMEFSEEKQNSDVELPIVMSCTKERQKKVSETNESEDLLKDSNASDNDAENMEFSEEKQNSDVELPIVMSCTKERQKKVSETNESEDLLKDVIQVKRNEDVTEELTSTGSVEVSDLQEKEHEKKDNTDLIDNRSKVENDSDGKDVSYSSKNRENKYEKSNADISTLDASDCDMFRIDDDNTKKHKGIDDYRNKLEDGGKGVIITDESLKAKQSLLAYTSDDEVKSCTDDDLKKRNHKKKDKLKKQNGDVDAGGRRKRMKALPSDSSSDEDDPNDDSQESKTPGKGRKKIHKIMEDENVGEATRRAAREEEERKKSILEKQKIYNELYKGDQGIEKVDKLILDFDPETKEELVSVHPDIVSKLKPHQVKGVKFMWDASFDSLKQIKKTKGSGCILAHCMGLGKTFQVVTLIHTLLNHKDTNVRTVLVVCPLSTVFNWVNEFGMWLKDISDGDAINVLELTKKKQNYCLKNWQEDGGVMIMGYDMYRKLTNTQVNRLQKDIETCHSTLVDPGPDLVVCDEGHLLKNEKTALAKAMNRIKTLRRIVLTGTPLQNNLREYHCMVQFMKPNLLGTRKEFMNRFVNPITNGQFEDSTAQDVKIMKRRAYVLHKMLEGSVQRLDYSVLATFLPPKHEFVISIRLSEVQVKAYRYYLDNLSMRSFGDKAKGSALFTDFQNLQRIWTHPRVLLMNEEKTERIVKKKRLMESDSEGSLRDFIDDDDDDTIEDDIPESSNKSSSGDGVQIPSDENNSSKKCSRSTRSKGFVEEPEIVGIEKGKDEKSSTQAWWKQLIELEELENIKCSGKLVLLYSILQECKQIGDKVLVFSQSLFSLDLIEHFLSCIDDATQNGKTLESLGNNTGSWALGLDYFRLDGTTSSEKRTLWCKNFNQEDNHRARLFIISTRAGGLGINLYAANRVIIFDASWNPSHDVQSIFRVYRYGQKKPCYIYRFLAQGTMEEKIYDRQVTKLSLSCRVVDEQQVERHFKMADLQELYQFDPEQKTKRPTPILPKDHLLAELLKEHEHWIVSYHEHDTLLENEEEEELNEEERKAAWDEYENEKKANPMLTGRHSALYEYQKKETPHASEKQLDQGMSLNEQIYDYLQKAPNELGTSNYQYSPAQLQSIQQYRIEQGMLTRDQQQETFMLQQNLQSATALSNNNMAMNQFLQDEKKNSLTSIHPKEFYGNASKDKSGVFKMHSKHVPIIAPSTSRSLNYGMGNSTAMNPGKVIINKKPPENKVHVPDDVIEISD